MVIQSWDTAAKKKESNDYWACTTWGLVAGEDSRIRMLDRTMDSMEYVEGRTKVKDQYAKWHPNRGASGGLEQRHSDRLGPAHHRDPPIAYLAGRVG
jgi:hypothetical protein